MLLKWTNLQKKYKIIIISALIVLLAGGGITAYAITVQQAYNNAVSTLDNSLKDLDTIQITSESLLVDSFLKADTTEEHIKELENQLAEINPALEEKYQEQLGEKLETATAKKKDVQALLTAVRTKLDTQNAVNSLYLSPALNGKITAEELVLVDTIDSKKLVEIKEKYFVDGDKIDEWQKAINQLITTAESQAQQVDKVKDLTSKYLKDKKVTEEVNPDIIKSLSAEVDKIANPTVKEKYAESKKTIETLYADKIKKLAEKKAKEVGGKAEKQKNGTYKIVATDNAEYNVSNTGKVEQTKSVAETTPTKNNDSTDSTNYNNSNNGDSSTGENTRNNATAPVVEESEPVYEEPYIVRGYIGNGGLFNSNAEAAAYVESMASSGWVLDNGYTGFEDLDVVYSDGSRYVSINWY